MHGHARKGSGCRMTRELYDSDFYADQREGSAASAAKIVPDLLSTLRPKSVVDVGCGVGTWLAAYASHGVPRYLGMDGPWARSGLLIPEASFVECNLPRAPSLDERFDLAQSLEVAEHIPSADAPAFVALLTRLSDVVVFSAAIPRQGGTHHINEQWPSYWQSLFATHGYRMYDAFRSRYWDQADVEWWYSQNMFLYVKEGTPVPPELEAFAGWVLPAKVVHPRRLEPPWNRRGVKQLVRELPPAVANATGRRVDRLVRAITRRM